MEETGFSETKLLMKENVRKYGSISSASGKNSKNSSNISYIRHEIQVEWLSFSLSYLMCVRCFNGLLIYFILAK